jgi:putative Mg2+ transporter-C (MgtC) family protein
MVIAISSCLFTILSIEGFPLQGSSQDIARVASQIVTGVGFLGAGVLLRTRSHIWGLTTAATIWLVAAIGMAIGTGAYFVAILTAILSTILLILLAPVSRPLEQRAQMLRKTHQCGREEAVEEFGEDSGQLSSERIEANLKATPPTARLATKSHQRLTPPAKRPEKNCNMKPTEM